MKIALYTIWADYGRYVCILKKVKKCRFLKKKEGDFSLVVYILTDDIGQRWAGVRPDGMGLADSFPPEITIGFTPCSIRQNSFFAF